MRTKPSSPVFSRLKKTNYYPIVILGGLCGLILWLIEFIFICRFYHSNALLWYHPLPVVVANILATGSTYFISGSLAAIFSVLISLAIGRRRRKRFRTALTLLSAAALSLAVILYLRFWLFGHLRITYHKVYFYLNLAFILMTLFLTVVVFIGVNCFAPRRDRKTFFASLTVFLGYCFIFGSHNNLMFYRFRKAAGLPRFSFEVAAANITFLLIALALGAGSWFLFRKFILRLIRIKRRWGWSMLALFFLSAVLLNSVFKDDWMKYTVQNPTLRESLSQPQKQKPNIIFIVMDALRADHLGCYGYSRDTTPFVDSLAEKGVLFQHYTSSTNFTFPFLNTLFSGYGYRKYFFHEHIQNPPRHLPLLPEMLRPAGYRSAAFIPLELSEKRDPGFTFLRSLGIGGGLPDTALQDTTFNNAFKNAFDAYSTSLTFSRKFWLYQLVERFFKFKTPFYLVRSDRFHTFCRRALDWIERDPDAPFFVYLHPRGAHHPYFPPPKADSKFFEGMFPDDAELANSLYSLDIVLKNNRRMNCWKKSLTFMMKLSPIWTPPCSGSGKS